MKIDWHRIITPSAWTQLGKVDWDYDAAMNAALDEFGVTPAGNHYCKIGDQAVWVSNFPYGYGHPVQENRGVYTLPSVKTRKRLRKMITESGGKWSFKNDQ